MALNNNIMNLIIIKNAICNLDFACEPVSHKCLNIIRDLVLSFNINLLVIAKETVKNSSRNI